MPYEHEVFLIIGDRLARAQVEDRLAVGLPTAVRMAKDAGGGAKVCHGFDSFHQPTLDGLEGNGDGHERAKFVGITIAGVGNVVVKVAIGPAQAARLAATGCQLEEFRFQPFPALMEFFTG